MLIIGDAGVGTINIGLAKGFPGTEPKAAVKQS